ncbi:MAG: hypothetical protein RSA49_05205 [Anaerovoracaceae bacterium]
MGIIKGVPVTLLSKIEVGKDEFDIPIYEEARIPVENVLISPVAYAEQVNELNLTAHKTTYNLAIPKGDVNIWENQRVEFWGKIWNVIGEPLEGIEENIPLSWNKKVTVESYE